MSSAAPAYALNFADDVTADLAELVVVRDRLAQALARCGWSEVDTFRVLLCADEVMANALAHGGGDAATINVQFRVSADEASIVATDNHPTWSVPPAHTALPDESSEHGRGLILMRALADTLRVTTSSLGTSVALILRQREGGER